VGCCPRDQLCDRCVADALAQLRGVAACRGAFWAVRVGERVRHGRPWPSYDDPKCRAIALSKVADLAVDDRLRDHLACIVNAWATRRWTAR